MSIEEFNALPTEDQLILLSGSAVQIANRHKGQYNYNLFQLAGFYIENKACKKNNESPQLHCYSASDLPEDYLQQIDISGLRC